MRSKPVVSTSNFLDYQATLPKREARITEHMILDMESKYVTSHISAAECPGRIELIHLTDLQYGAKSYKADRFAEYREWILSVPNRFVLLGGDIIDSATLLSKGSAFENTGQPRDQVYGVLEELTPLRGRILAYVGGNHERRTEKTFGEAGHLIATMLKIPYSRGRQVVDVHYGKHQPFKISLWHGSGSARTKGAKMQMLHRFMGQGDSQAYLVGHLHDVVATYDWRQIRDLNKKVINLQKIAGVMSSSFQAYWNTYAEVFGMSPSDTMMARLVLEEDGGWELTLK